MNNLKEILDLLAEKEAEAAINPDSVDPRVKAGVEAKVRNALQELPAIQDRYKDEVINSVVIIAVSGPLSEEFASIASNKMNALSVDFQLAKKRLRDNLVARNAAGPYTTNTHFMLLDEMQKLRLDYKFLQLPAPVLRHYAEGILDEQLDPALTMLIKNNYGNSLYSAITRREIGNVALRERFSGKHLPVIVYNYTGSVDPAFLPEPVLVYEANDEVSEKTVKKVLSEVRAAVLGRKSKQTGSEEGQTQEDA